MQERWAGRADYWREVIERQGDSGQSIAQFCGKEGVHSSSFFLWRRKLGLGPSPIPAKQGHGSEGGTFMKVTVTGEEIGAGSSFCVELPSGVRIHVENGFDEESFRRILAALERN